MKLCTQHGYVSDGEPIWIIIVSNLQQKQLKETVFTIQRRIGWYWISFTIKPNAKP